MNISSSLRQYSLPPLCMCTHKYTHLFFFLLYTLSFGTFLLFIFLPTCPATSKPGGLSDLKSLSSSLSPSFSYSCYKILHFCILTTHSRTSLLKGFLLLPRNSPIIWRLRPFLCSRKCATPMGVSGMKPREMRNWRPLSGFLFKKTKKKCILNCTDYFISSIT